MERTTGHLTMTASALLVLAMLSTAAAQQPQGADIPWYGDSPGTGDSVGPINGRNEASNEVPAEVSLEMMGLPLRHVPFRESPFGAEVHYGNGIQPSSGYPNYEYPMKRYDMWYLPRQFGITRRERCIHERFNPRGYGNLFAIPSTQYRMDYSPYVMHDHESVFGPSYYRRRIEPHCPCCPELRAPYEE